MHRATLYKECSQSWLLAHAKHKKKKKLYTPRYLYYNTHYIIIDRAYYTLTIELNTCSPLTFNHWLDRDRYTISHIGYTIPIHKELYNLFLCVCERIWSLARSTRRSLVRAAPYSKQRYIKMVL